MRILLRSVGTTPAAVLFVTTVLGACAPRAGDDMADENTTDATAPAVHGLNAFYYYEDVDAAWAFYRDVLGFETVADFGFAKIMRVAPTSYLTLVDEERGMHSASEPKSVTLAVVTREVEGWYDYLVGRGVQMRAELNVREGSAHDGFVAIDPEGYFLEFEWFNEHAENVSLTPRLDAIDPLPGGIGDRPSELTVHATVFWLYYDELSPVQFFYEQLFDTQMIVDQGWAKVYPIAPTGYIGFVDGSRGLHPRTEQKAVTLSFLTDDVDEWLSRAEAFGVELRTGEVGNESDRVRTLVGYGVDGYYLEWDTFLDVEANARLLETLR